MHQQKKLSQCKIELGHEHAAIEASSLSFVIHRVTQVGYLFQAMTLNDATMSKMQRMRTRIKSFGLYEAWDGDQKHVPRISEFTTTIPARIGIEFGYIIHIDHGRGNELRFEIDHPPWLRDDGSVEPPFQGTFFVRHNDFDFFLGDTIWEPWENKLGTWTLRTWFDETLLAEKSFEIIDPDI